jgi:diguanylate cyclase (GGDEF)-like protein
MVATFVAVYAAILILLAVLLGRIHAQKRGDTGILLLITVLCMIQMIFTLFQFANMSDLQSLSAESVVCHLVFGIICVLTDVIFILVLMTVLRFLKLGSKKTRRTLIFFCIFTCIDAFFLLSNPWLYFSFSYIPQPLFACKGAPVTLIFVNTGWLRVHQLFSLLVGIMIFTALLLKCVKLPFMYAGKYLFLGFSIIIIAGLNTVYTFAPSLSFKVNYPLFFFDLIPFILFHFMYHYQPRLMLFQLRRMVFENLGSPVILFDVEDRLADYNEDAATLFALESQQIGLFTIQDFLKRSIDNQMRERSTSTVEEITVASPSGVSHVYKLDYTRLSNSHKHSRGTLMVFHDITELKKLYNTMEKAAMTDQLTGLASSALLKKKITEINLYRKFPYSAVVCNINGLRLISDGFGEDAGKAATMHVAEILRQQLRASDFAAYQDGNMVVLMPDTEEKEAEKVFERISGILSLDRSFSFILSFEYGIAIRATPDTDMQFTVNQAASSMAKKKMLSSNSVHNSIVESLQESLKMSSFETEQHSRRVQALAVQIADRLKMTNEQIEQLKLLSMFHDIGKLSVPREILLKPSKLTKEERQIMDMHTINGYKIANISPELQPIARGILCHHEHWDGTGYPNSYAGEQIPYLSRIISVADAYDVMTHDRSYKQAMSTEEAREEIKRNFGKQFDPVIAKVFLALKLQ